MQYVGRFVSSVYNTITPNINPATLSGAIDVIVVERQVEVEVEEESEWGGGEKVKKKIMTTELASTPFHVRFGKMSVLRPAERKVTLHLNNSYEPLPFAMKVGEEGEAFFVLELGEDEINDGIPDDLVTSPILSAAPSPIVAAEQSHDTDSHSGEAGTTTSDYQADAHRAPRKFIQEDYVEPLDLGASRAATSNYLNSDLDSNETSTIRSGETRASTDTGITSLSTDGPGANAAQPEKATEKSVKDDHDQGGDDVEQTDNTGMFGGLEEAASKAGGALGAAGRSILPSLGSGNKRNAKLEKVVKRAEKEGLNLEETLTGASKDEKVDNQSAHHYEPTKGAEVVSRMQMRDNGHPPDDINDAKTETDKLEVQMRDRAKDLVTKTVQARQERRRSSTQTKAQTRNDSIDLQEEAYSAPFGSSGGATLASTETAPTTQSDHADFLAGIKIDPVDSGISGKDAVFPAQVDSRTVRGRLQKYEEERQKDSNDYQMTSIPPDEEQGKADKGKVDDSKVASKVSGRKENLQYMLDMDGYKMTADGEDLAFAEGHRFANELPLSRRHGGGGVQGHGEVLSQPHQYTINQMSHLKLSGDQSPLPSLYRRGSLGDVNTKPASIAREGHKRRGSHSAATSEAGDSLPYGEESRSATIIHERDALALSRGLVRLTRSLRTSTANPEMDTLPTMRRSQRRHQDASLSDHEVETGDSAHSRHIRATSEEAPNRFGDESPPIVRDDTALGRNPDYEWGWGQLPKRDINAALQLHRRNRVLSSPDLLDEAGGSNIEGHSSEGRLICDEQDPYRFILELEDANHSFELSLCYVEGVGQSTDGGASIEVDANHRERTRVDDWMYHFDENKVSYQRFLDDEEVVNDERVVLRYNDRLLTWENASAVLATLSLYRKTLSVAIQDGQTTVKGQTATNLPQLGQRASVWRRWWNRNKENIDNGVVAGDLKAAHEEGNDNDSLQPGLDRSNTDSLLHSKPKMDQKRANSAATVPVIDTQMKNKDKKKKTKTYAKTLRLTSDQLKTLNLRKGANSITFSVTSSYSGVATCTARIFLWDANHQIVVSDIDGTITKSDALGHVFTMIGRDWTHIGVAKLYTDIARNGYRIMYLTSRAIGQADTTRDYLKGIRQNNFKLPDGPVIMSPDRLMASLHREVILRKPEVFKMACLRDIARLFGADPRHALPLPSGTDLIKFDQDSLDESVQPGAGNVRSPGQGAATKSNDQHASPFYAGFGNRITDALSYRSVNIPSSRIFTIDSNGEVKMELLELAGYKSSYIHMTDLVDQMFPPITLKSTLGNEGKPEFNDFNYWRPNIEQFELPSDDELMPSPVNSSPTSPALSARSVKSNASLRSRAHRSPPAETSPSRDDINYNNGEEVGSSRLSRFGLGKLGMSRKNSSSSAHTVPTPGTTMASDETNLPARKASNGSASVFAVSNNRSTNDLSVFDTSTSSQVSKGDIQQNYAQTPSSPSSYGSGVTSWAASWRRRATSPGNTVNSNGNGAQATSPLVGPVITAEPEEDELGEGQEDDDVSSMEDEDDGQGDLGDDVIEDDDPLLATGEIQFEWRG